MSVKDISYDMTFHQVLDEVFEIKGWYQGELFTDGVFITVNENGFLKVKTFNRSSGYTKIYETELFLNKAMLNQKYRKCSTEVEIERRA